MLRALASRDPEATKLASAVAAQARSGEQHRHTRHPLPLGLLLSSPRIWLDAIVSAALHVEERMFVERVHRARQDQATTVPAPAVASASAPRGILSLLPFLSDEALRELKQGGEVTSYPLMLSCCHTVILPYYHTAMLPY